MEKGLVTPVTAHRRVSTSVVLGRGAGSWGAEPRHPHTRAWHQEGPTPQPRARAASRPRCPARRGWAELGAWVRPPGLPASRAAREGDGGGRRRHQRDGPFRLCRTPACGSERGGRALGRRSRAAPRQLAWGRCSATSLPVCRRGTSRVASWPSGVGAFCAQGALGRGAQGGRRGRGCRQG